MPLLQSIDKNELLARVKAAYKLMEECRLCPRRCGVNRFKEVLGVCGMGRKIMISSYGPHFGEEDVLVGKNGSGTIFLTGCNLGCIFCQNYDISHTKIGHPVAIEEFARIMLELERMGCHNINFVTPTHFVPQILEAVIMAKEKGLNVPLVFNCGGYESMEILKLLDGIIDIYMPDVKFADSQVSGKFCNAPDYPEVVKRVLIEMHRQTGDLTLDPYGIATRGLLVRHLVLPNGQAGTEELMHFIAENVSKDTYVNIMAQYRPLYQAREFPEINRGVTIDEYNQAGNIAKTAGLHRGFFGR
jgi:putative pyruvate formate lyase activating enzyme